MSLEQEKQLPTGVDILRKPSVLFQVLLRPVKLLAKILHTDNNKIRNYKNHYVHHSRLKLELAAIEFQTHKFY